VRYKKGAEPTLNVDARSIPLRAVNTSEALHALMRRENFEETSLRDAHGDCADWSYKGQCFTNSVYMWSTCPKSCTDTAPDADPACRQWAREGQCEQNAKFMAESCLSSCHAAETRKHEL
jgi:hypothetical protein